VCVSVCMGSSETTVKQERRGDEDLAIDAFGYQYLLVRLHRRRAGGILAYGAVQGVGIFAHGLHAALPAVCGESVHSPFDSNACISSVVLP
jgi:hypothetical protein